MSSSSRRSGPSPVKRTSRTSSVAAIAKTPSENVSRREVSIAAMLERHVRRPALGDAAVAGDAQDHDPRLAVAGLRREPAKPQRDAVALGETVVDLDPEVGVVREQRPDERLRRLRP